MREQLSEYTIVYAEDEADVRERMLPNLEGYFKEVFVAKNGEEAFKLYLNRRPHVMLLDINMPILDGLEVAERVRQSDKKTRIIVLTAHTDENLLIQAVELELSRYLVKPVKPKAFKEALDKVAYELMHNSTDVLVLPQGCHWNRSEHKLYQEDKEVTLTVKEQKLMTLLVKHRARCVSTEEIMAHVWEDQFDDDISRDSVKTQVNYLRRKLPKDIIKNVYGSGYMME